MQRRMRQFLTRHLALVIAVVLTIVGGAGAAWYLVAGQHGPPDGAFRMAGDLPPAELDAAAIARVETFCGDCHPVPRPNSFPRDAWYVEVRKGYEFYVKSGRTDLQPPTIAETLAYYVNRAPTHLSFPDVPDAANKLNVKFRVERRKFQEPGGVAPAIAHLKWVKLWPDADPVLVVADMRSGKIMSLPITAAAAQPKVLASLDNPCRVEPCDLDGDGTMDLVVADLGSFRAMDRDRGRIVWLRGRADSRDFEPIVIASGLGRTADVRPADFDRDGDLDLVVAVFGMECTGDIRVLWNITEPGQRPQFREEVVDPRPGSIHVPPVDLNGDGYLDFASVISQNYEQVAIYMNQLGLHQQTASFYLQTLWTGPDLTFGSAGIELSDLDSDGDVDIVYTNGDAFDNCFVNPSHGVQWLENKGRLEFAYHRLTDLTGAYTTRVGDLDGDGDQDIIVTAWLPSEGDPKNAFDRPLASILCLEQTAPGQFARHTLEREVYVHAAVEMADFDGDGDLDFVAGSHVVTAVNNAPYWIAVWWNEGKLK